MNKVELQKMAGGIVQEKFAKAFEKVIDNLQDTNTSYKTRRKIEIKLTFDQNEARDDVHVGIDVVEKLAPQTAFSTSYSIGKDLKTGEVFVQEYGKQLSGQLSMKDIEPTTEAAELPTDIKVDPATGEVIEENVIDFRKVAEK